MMIRNAIKSLSPTRPVFHSEADFQHALAWAVHLMEPDAEVRIEVPSYSSDSRRYLDLVVRHGDSQIGIELKYKTRMLLAETPKDTFFLEDQSAQDLGRYDFFKDIERLEQFVAGDATRVGIAVFLTNDSAYWKPPGRPTVGYGQFAMTEGRIASGELIWQEGAGEGTRKNRESAIRLAGSYLVTWNEYSILQCKLPRASGGYGRFRYAIAEVGQLTPRPTTS